MSLPGAVPDPSATSGADATAVPSRIPSDGGRGTEIRFHHSARFPQVLEEAGCSVLVSTYQAGQLVAVGVADGQLTFSFRGFERAMGIAVGADRLALGGNGQIWSLRDHSELAAAMTPAGRYDKCWLPRSSTRLTHALSWRNASFASMISLLSPHVREDTKPNVR